MQKKSLILRFSLMVVGFNFIFAFSNVEPQKTVLSQHFILALTFLIITRKPKNLNHLGGNFKLSPKLLKFSGLLVPDVPYLPCPVFIIL